MNTQEMAQQARKTIDGLTEIRNKLDPNSAQAEQLRWWIDAKKMELDEILAKGRKEET